VEEPTGVPAQAKNEIVPAAGVQSEESVSGSGVVPTIPDIEKKPLGLVSKQAAAQEGAAQGDGGRYGWMVKTVGALVLVLCLIFAAKAALGRMTGSVSSSGFNPAVEVLSRVAIAPRNHILLIRLGKRVLVLSDSSAGLRKLADVSDPDEVAGLLASVSVAKPNSISHGFSQLLRRFNSDYRLEEAREEGADHGEHAVDRARHEVGSLLNRVRLMAGRGGVA
jgi:flagellar biogenesis protein FliO